MRIVTDIRPLMEKMEYTCIFYDKDEQLNFMFNCYHLLGNTALTSHETLETILYSKYYWYNKYKNRYQKLHGEDAGVEQQQFMLLEEIEDKIGTVDRKTIEKIEKMDCK